MNDMTEPQVSVHVASVGTEAAGVLGRPKRARARYRAVYRTVHLTAAEPAQDMWAAADDRVVAYIVPLDDNITISDNKSDAAAGTGATIPQSTPWPVYDSSVTFAGAATFSGGSGAYSRVSVTAYYEVKS